MPSSTPIISKVTDPKLSDVQPVPRPARKSLVERESLSQRLKVWVIPLGILLSIALVGYLGLGMFDLPSGTNYSFWDLTLATNPDSVTDATSHFVELLAAILGIMITVVAIVLQLAAQRYGTRLIDLFLDDRINRMYFSMMVCALLYSILLVYGIKEQFFPHFSILGLLLITEIEIALLAPYFLYVFRFLTPTNLLFSIQTSTKKAVLEVVSGDEDDVTKLQMEVANGIEQVTDSALSAVNQMDRNLGLMALNQIREMVLDYQEVKHKLPEPWFLISQDYFVGLSQVFYQEICEKKMWVEAKAFMDMELIFRNSIRVMPDAVSAIARNTRLLGKEAIHNQDNETLDLVVQFFNTFIRVSINDKNVRAIFNLFYQYRLLTESIMDYDPKLTAKVLFYFKYYGETCLQQGLWFVMLTAAFDLGGMVGVAHDKQIENIEELLLIFMSLEDNVDAKKDFLAFDAVRKAQLILATYIFSKGETKLLDLVIEDLKSETFEKLLKYRDSLLAVQSKKFWEVTDRGYTFEYMEPDQKEALRQFFEQRIVPQKDVFALDPADAPPEVPVKPKKPRKAGPQKATDSKPAKKSTAKTKATKASKRDVEK